jgi:PleD family two-component response regulator
MTEPEPGGASVSRLRPLRVLLVGHDRRFLRMAGMLFSRHGWDVAQLERSSELLDEVHRRQPNVVVLDGTASLNATARVVAALEALPGPVHPLVVYEGTDEDALRKLRLLPKWGAFDEIVREVERLYQAPLSTSEAS